MKKTSNCPLGGGGNDLGERKVTVILLSAERSAIQGLGIEIIRKVSEGEALNVGERNRNNVGLFCEKNPEPKSTGRLNLYLQIN